jgi:biopolymer transport protein TolR
MRTVSTRGSVQAQPNVTPMIDVMLVLLIVFMVAGPMLAAGVPAVPPTAVNLKSHPEDPADYTLGIDIRGQYYLGRKVIAADSLESRLDALFADRAEDHVLYVRADRAVHYAALQFAMDRAARAGAKVVSLIAEVPAGRREAP